MMSKTRLAGLRLSRERQTAGTPEIGAWDYCVESAVRVLP